MNLTKSKTAKLVAGFVGLVMALSFALPVSAATAEELQAQINSLLSTIQSLQAQLSATTGGTATTAGYQFNTNLTVGSKGVDVLNLQKVLNSSADTRVASTGAGSPGMETSTFGPATKAAVIKFQVKNGITPAAGYVGAITRAKLNSLGGTTTGGTTTGGTTLPTGGALTVSGTAQPANSLAPYGASRVPFTKVTLTAGSSDVTVNSITVQRSGLGVDANFAGVVLLDEQGLQVGIAKTLNSNHQALVGEPFVIKAGTSKTLTVAGNMAAQATVQAGQVVGLDVVAVNTTATVAGSLPVTGAMHTINANLAIGAAQIGSSSFDPVTASSQPIGTTGFRFSGVRITATAAEDVTLKSIRWNQTGSAGATDLANVVTVVNGTSYPTVVSTDGKYFTSTFPAGIVITKGNSVDVYLQGDLVGSGSSGRSVQFDIYKTTDIYMTGNTYGYGVTFQTGSYGQAAPNTGANTANTPFFHGSLVSITGGSVTLIGKANEVASQNIAVNVPNQVLGGFATNFSGEPVSVQTMTFTVSTSSSIGGAITSVTLVDSSGAVVAGPVDTGYTSGATQTITFSDTVTFPVGRAVYTLKGKIASSASNGATLYVSTNPSSWLNVTGQTTGTTVTIPTTSFSMNTMTIKGASLAINISAQPTSQSVVAGVQNLVLANYTLDASQSGEDVRLSSFPVLPNTLPTTGSLTGCQLYNGSTPLNTGSRVVNSMATSSALYKTFSFDNSLVVSKGTVVTLALQCNVSSPATGAVQIAADTTLGDYTVTGQISGNTVGSGTGLTAGSSAGGIMALTNGSLAMSIDAASPAYTVINGGATGVTVAAIKLRASNEAMTLTKLGLNLYAGSASDIISAKIYSGATQVGTLQFVQGTASATSTLNTTVDLPKDTDVVLTVKADFAAIGSGMSGTAGKLVQVDPLNAEASGVASGTTLGTSASASTHVAGVRTFRAYPTLAQDTLSSTGIGDGKLLRFKVTATNGTVGVQQFKFTLATTTLNVTNIGLYAYTDASYSTPISSQGVSGQIGSTLAVGNLGSGVYTLTATPTSNPIQIPVGTTYFELRGTVGANQTGASVVTTLLGDAAYPTGLTSGYYVATSSSLTASNFIWAGNSTTTSVTADVDWSNGYGLSGFPSAGIIQGRSY